jgi:glycosyltransferase involved in cell wall biosynthesis
VAVVPIFVLGPNAVLSLIGHIRGPKPVQEPDPVAIRDLDVDVVIPAYNERSTIALCLASVMRQTLKPSSVTVIDDGSDDDTAAVAQAFASANDFAIRIIRRRYSIGKTPGLKIESRNLEGDVEFILDADTVLISEDFIEHLVTQLWRVPGIAAASGMVYPLRDRDRAEIAQLDSVQRLQRLQPQLDLTGNHRTLINRITKGIANFYRDAIFQFMQAFFYAGVQNLLGSMPNPVGCAVAYRREYLRELFDTYEPSMGDNMTSSEDIFFGTAFIASGYHNIQNLDVIARTEVPEIHRIPRQLVKWSSAWLQSAYYLPDVVVSPFRVFKRYQNNKRNRAAAQKRRIVDGYRQPFGRRFAQTLGRPGGWLIFCGLFEKVSFLLVLLLLIIIDAWWYLFLTILFETFLFTAFLVYFSPGRRFEFLIKGIAATPFRYGMMLTDLLIFARFVFDLVVRRREWRK